MEHWLVILLYPAVMFLILQPRASQLARRRQPNLAGLLGLRETLEKQLEDRGRWFLAGKLLIAAVMLVVWAKRYDFGVALLAVPSRPLGFSLSAGFVGGALLICARLLFQAIANRVPGASKDLSRYSQTRGTVTVWLVILLLGCTFEEPWRAFCLIACGKAGWSQLSAITVTSIAFDYAQRSGIPPRVPGPNFEDLWELLLGAFLGVSFLEFGTVVTPFVASLAYRLANLAFLRKAASSSKSIAGTSGNDSLG